MDQGGHHLRRRAACDRCHSQKLRCVKPNGSDICARCLKARVSCVYSPSMRGVRPSADNPNGAVLNASNDMSISNGRFNGSLAGTGFIDNDDSFNDTMDWNAPGAFDILPDFGMVQGLSEFTLNDPLLGLVADGGVDHSSKSGTDSSTVSSSAMGSVLNGNGIIQATSRHVSETPTSTVNGSDLSKDDGSNPLADHIKTSENPRTSLLKTLTDLSLKLFEHANSLPTLPTKEEVADALREASRPNDDGTTDRSLEEQSIRYEKVLDKDFALDQTFQLSQALIDFYPRFIKSLLHCKPPLAADLPADLRVDPPSRKGRRSQTSSSECPDQDRGAKHSKHPSIPDSKTSAAPRVALDHPSILLLLSCHLRLIEVYENIFSHSHICMHEALLPGRKPQAMTSNVPVLKIGSYTPPTTSTVHMHLLLLEQLNEQLLESVESLLSEIRKVDQRDEEKFSFVDCDEGEDANEDGQERVDQNMRPKHVDVTELTCLAVRDRAKGVLETVMWFRKLLIKHGWIRAAS